MTKEVTVKFTCDLCDREFSEEADSFGELTWVCPECKSKEKVYLIDIKELHKNDEPIVMGRGGCRQK